MTLLPIDDPRWRAFVEGHPRATPFHHPDWAQLVADCYRFRVFAFAVADEHGSSQAGAPMVEVRQPLGRRRWVSLPFTDACQPLAATADDESALADALTAAATEAGVSGVGVRAQLAGATQLGEPALRHVLPLEPDPAAVYARFHPSQVQRNIRRAEREGLTVRRGSNRADLLDTFYGLHLRTRQRQGVPIQPRRFFELIWERAISRGLGWVSIVESSGRPIAAALFLGWNGTVVY
ncbi:MAG TPA: GNAT family N-acetyltransferase, partial [Candidatus Limnocylindria bacterium]